MQGGHWEATTVPQVRGDGGLSQVIIVEMTEDVFSRHVMTKKNEEQRGSGGSLPQSFRWCTLDGGGLHCLGWGQRRRSPYSLEEPIHMAFSSREFHKQVPGGSSPC